MAARIPRILYGGAARGALVRGIDAMAALVAPTLGPVARTIVVDSLVSTTPEVLDSGSVIARRTIQLSDPFEDMGAMLLRHVLLAIFERNGDGSATTAVLTHALVHGLHRYVESGANLAQLERGLDCAVDLTLGELTAMSRPIEGAERIARVAVAAARDPRLADIIGDILDATGADGAIVVEDGEAAETSYEYMEGIRWNEGLVSEALLEVGQSSLRLIDASVLVTDCALERPDEFLPVLDECIASGTRRLCVVAPHIGDAVVGLLVLNRQRGVVESIAAVRAPLTGDTRAAILGDIAVASGGRVLQAAAGGLKGFDTGHLGSARQVWATRKAFGILGGRGSRVAVRNRVAEARGDLARAEDDRHLRSVTQHRIGNLMGLGAVIRVGAPSTLARDELHLRADAALSSARCALQGGVVAGGGAALVACAAALSNRGLRGEEGRAAAILASALCAPMRAIARHAGWPEPGAVVEEARKRGPAWTFDAVRGMWVDAWEAGILDPTPVVRSALEASVSVAHMAMTTGALVRRRQTPPPAGR